MERLNKITHGQNNGKTILYEVLFIWALLRSVFVRFFSLFASVHTFSLFLFDNPIYKTYVALILDGKIILRSRRLDIQTQ